jgi:tetratricopeptide (TPR) repeat protein
VADKVPESPFKINGRYDAGTVLLELKAWGEAITTLVDFRDDYPKHKLTKEVSIKLALAYEGNGQLDKAAAELQRVAQLEKESGVAAEAAWNAAELYERSGEKLRAIDQFKRYVEKYAQPLERNVEGRNRLAELYAGQKDEARQTYWLKQVVSGHRSARKAATARTQFLAAGATFQLADISAREFESIRLVLPLEKSLTRKQKAMKKAIDAYSEAAKYGAAEYTTASTFRIAEVYRQLGSDMLASERPKELNELEREQYDILLEEEAFPFEEKAIEIHLINTARTKEGLYDKWIKQTYDALAALLPARYAKREEGEVGFAQTP